MSVFGDYSRYYDLFYGDKAYAEEAGFVHGGLLRHGVATGELLEVGCGTGRHAAELASLGWRVHGIDVSDRMLDRAREALRSLPDEEARRLSFASGDARDYRAGRTFAAVISLFHVMSYQTANADLLSAFTTAGEHLEPGGVFLFDCWYGPAVLTQMPEHREKTLEDAEVTVTRVAEPVMRPNDDVCEVHYDVRIVSKADGAQSRIAETHEMRYLFQPEVRFALDACGFDLVEAVEFGTGRPLGFDTWNGCFVARKR